MRTIAPNRIHYKTTDAARVISKLPDNRRTQHRCFAHNNPENIPADDRVSRWRIYFSSELSISISATRCSRREIEPPPFGDEAAVAMARGGGVEKACSALAFALSREAQSQ